MRSLFALSLYLAFIPFLSTLKCYDSLDTRPKDAPSRSTTLPDMNCRTAKYCTSFEGVVDGYAVKIARCDGWIAGVPYCEAVGCSHQRVPMALPNGRDVDVQGKACCCKGDHCNNVRLG